jgi:NAD(P)-dependent dehydrogenase (short-subunit alcohol dehydrogenase family)
MRILAVTQFSAHHCCKAAARHMLSAGRGGSIIVVGSVMADFSHPTSSTYTSSKCAVKKLGEVMSRELAPHGIRVNVVQPGHIATANEVAYMDAAARCG